MMQQERRLTPRKALDHLAYISLPHNNGGIVIDVSEGGLRFHAIAPVRASGPIAFRFEVDSGARIEAIGELAWRDATGKSGGLRFTQLPEEIREQIRVWTGQSSESAATSVLDVPVAKPSVETEATPSRAADLPLAGNILAANSAIAAEAAPRGEVDLAPFEYVAVSEPEIAAEAASTGTVQLTPFEDIPAAAGSAIAAEPAIDAEISPSLETDWLPVVSPRNPVLYSLRPPIYSAPYNEFSMFPLFPKRDVAVTPAPTLESIALSHPVAAVGLTIALAFFISIGIFAYVSTSWAGDLLYDLAGQMWSRPPSQAVPPAGAPAPKISPDASRLSHR